jgi:hypothetical protein
MWSVHPSATCDVDPNPLKILDDCLNYRYVRIADDWFRIQWPKVFMGYHEGLETRETSVKPKNAISIGHFLARGLEHTCACLDYCIRRGYDLSCDNKHVVTVLYRAIDHLMCIDSPSPTALSFFQVLADAHALFDDGTKRVPKNIVAKQIRDYIGKSCKELWFDLDIALLEQIATMFDK